MAISLVHIAGGPATHTILFTTSDGAPIPGISACDIELRVGEMARAIITVSCAAIDMDAHAILSLKTLQESAEHHGFHLIKKPT